MKNLTKAVVFAGLIPSGLVLNGLGCQEVDGECWPVSEDGKGVGVGAGAGGGPIIPGGVGGFGVSPGSAPQDEPDVSPTCVAMGGSSCSYDPDNDTCGPLNLEECYEDCAYVHGREMEACSRKKDRKKRNACYDQANQKHAACRRECKKKFPPKE